MDDSWTVLYSLYDNFQALLSDRDSQGSPQKGILRWNLQKMLETHPSCVVLLIKSLVKDLLENLSELHKAHSCMCVVPKLHTLHSVLLQSSVIIPTTLYQDVYECLKKLLILPLPYSALVLNILRSIKMEITTPGSLYQRKVIAEQNIKSKHFNLQEKIFVLADPAVISGPLEASVREQLQVPGLLKDTAAQKRFLVFRCLRRGLDQSCQSSELVRVLEALEDDIIDKYFQDVVQAMEQHMEEHTGGHSGYLQRLQNIYRDILSVSEEGRTIDCSTTCSTVCNTAMPLPEVILLFWKNEQDLCDLLVEFALGSNSSLDGKEKEGQNSAQSKNTMNQSFLTQGVFDDTRQCYLRKTTSTMTRRKAFRKTGHANWVSEMMGQIEACLGKSQIQQEAWTHTARVVVMGDNRVLGRLSRVYHSIHQQSKYSNLTKNLNLQFYYIPVTGVQSSVCSPESPCPTDDMLSYAYLLGNMDPWYHSTISSLREFFSHYKTTEKKFFLLETLCYYFRCGNQPVNLPLYSVKITLSGSDERTVVEEVFLSHLEVALDSRELNKQVQRKQFTSQRKSRADVQWAVISLSYVKSTLSKRVEKRETVVKCRLVAVSVSETLTPDENFLAISFDTMKPQDKRTIRTPNTCIKAVDDRTLSVCLDKDSRRTYNDVHRLQIAPCLRPGSSIKSWQSCSTEQALPLSNYISLPINTFTGGTL